MFPDTSEERSAAKARRAQHRQSRCVMVLPPDSDLEGRRVLDIGCRRGLGAFKIADRVGPAGSVVGSDPSASCIEEACAQAPKHHWAGDDWGSYLRFVCSDVDGLEASGLQPGAFDVVVVNSVLNLEEDLAKALGAIARLLAPGGYLYHDAVLAKEPMPGEGARLCREASNVFGCAPTRNQLEDALARAGFDRWSCKSLQPVEPPVGDRRDDLAGREFQSAVVQAYL